MKSLKFNQNSYNMEWAPLTCMPKFALEIICFGSIHCTSLIYTFIQSQMRTKSDDLDSNICRYIY